jgi:glucose-1-phosphate cytidylyltransferase
MKVVLFAGGMGARLRDYSDQIPKPLVEVGQRPILWHLMKYYSHYGHRDFIVCLGHGGQKIKQYFLNYDESATNNFVLSNGGKQVELLSTDIHDWTITFVDTGLTATVGERLRLVEPYLGSDEYFLANYADALSDLPLDGYVDSFIERGTIGCFLSVPAPHTFHIVHADQDQYVQALEHISESRVRINAGFFVFRRDVFEYMRPNEELVIETFQRLIDKRELLAVPYDGFWQNMDTFKDKMLLDEIYARGNPPWQVWAR